MILRGVALYLNFTFSSIGLVSEMEIVETKSVGASRLPASVATNLFLIMLFLNFSLTNGDHICIFFFLMFHITYLMDKCFLVRLLYC
jgi:hypothetical protein